MRILLVEDSGIERRQIGRYLKDWNLEFVTAKDGVEAWSCLQSSDAPNLVLLDWMLPRLDGIELARRIRTLGANGIFHQSLRFAATHDFLTKLLNRAEILASLRRELSRSAREDKPVAIIMADVDNFKKVNDSLGHAVGDTVLKEVGERLKSDLRPYDLVGRYGGEEFLIVLPNCSLKVAARRADEIRTLVCKDAIVTTFATVPVTVSMGITATEGTQNLPIEELLQQSDKALYNAKENGRNCVQTFLARDPASRRLQPTAG